MLYSWFANNFYHKWAFNFVIWFFCLLRYDLMFLLLYSSTMVSQMD